MAEDSATPGTDPFKDRTYRERRALLGFSAASIAITHLGLVPSGIPTLGVQRLTEVQRSGLVTLLFGIVAYFLVMFLVYAVSDFLEWRAAVARVDINLRADREAAVEMKEDFRDGGGLSESEDTNIHQALIQAEIEMVKVRRQQIALDEAKKSPWFRASRPAGWVRLFFDMVLPFGLAVIALPLLWTWKSPC